MEDEDVIRKKLERAKITLLKHQLDVINTKKRIAKYQEQLNKLELFNF